MSKEILNLFAVDSYLGTEESESNQEGSQRWQNQEIGTEESESNQEGSQRWQNQEQEREPNNISTQQNAAVLHLYEKTEEEPNVDVVYSTPPIQTTQREVYCFPKETKNFYKNVFTTLQSFLKDTFPDECKTDPNIKKFLATKPQNQSKIKFLDFFKFASKLKTITQFFFLNKFWAKYLIKNNKCDLEPYFRLSQQLI